MALHPSRRAQPNGRFTFVPRAGRALSWTVWLGVLPALSVLAACEMSPDIVARATDASTGLNEDDAGDGGSCEFAEAITPVDCEIPVPWPIDFDPRLINVNVTQGGELVRYGGGLLSIDNCTHVVHGWYWVDPDEYTRIGFCPQTCALIDQWQQLFFEFGCNTLPPWLLPPRQ